MLTLAFVSLAVAVVAGIIQAAAADSRLSEVIHLVIAALNALAAYGVWGVL